MKKSLMILASVALGASMAAATDVTSRNVVGFNTSSNVSGEWKQQAMQFDKIGGGTLTLADLTVPAGTEIAIAGIDPEDGSVTFTSYYYFSEEGLEGWYSGSYANSDGVEIPAGTAFWLIPVETETLTVMGEVADSDVNVSLVSGEWQMLCNPFPMPIKLSDVSQALEVGKAWGGTIVHVAKILPEDGSVDWDSYYYFTDEGLTGWFTGSYAPSDNVEIPVGQGFWLVPSDEGNVTFETPL